MDHFKKFTDNLLIMLNSNMGSDEFKSSDKIIEKITKMQTHKLPKKNKALALYAHFEQNFNHSETINIFQFSRYWPKPPLMRLLLEPSFMCFIFIDFILFL